VLKTNFDPKNVLFCLDSKKSPDRGVETLTAIVNELDYEHYRLLNNDRMGVMTTYYSFEEMINTGVMGFSKRLLEGYIVDRVVDYFTTKTIESEWKDMGLFRITQDEKIINRFHRFHIVGSIDDKDIYLTYDSFDTENKYWKNLNEMVPALNKLFDMEDSVVKFTYGVAAKEDNELKYLLRTGEEV